MLIRAALIMLLSTAPALALAQSTNQYLVFPNSTAAHARSKAECNKLKCDGVKTTEWWAVIDNLTDGTSAAVIDGAPYSTTDLNPAERNALISEASATAAGFPTPTWAATQVPPQ